MKKSITPEEVCELEAAVQQLTEVPDWFAEMCSELVGKLTPDDRLLLAEYMGLEK